MHIFAVSSIGSGVQENCRVRVSPVVDASHRTTTLLRSVIRLLALDFAALHYGPRE